MKNIAILNLLLLISAASASADDWTQWAGNDRQCTWNESGILKRFPVDGLAPTWSTPIGSGYSGPVVWQGRVFVTDYRPKPGTIILEAFERVLCLDEQSGKILWSHQWETHYRRQLQSYATGPRATPLVDGGRLYTMGATGRVHCFDAESGNVEWEYDALEEFGAEVPIYAMSASPVAWKETVIFVCGGRDGRLRALDKASGKEKWKALPANYDMPYSSPVILEIAGT
jgi:outer membrane protein assembly factor BamB